MSLAILPNPLSVGVAQWERRLHQSFQESHTFPETSSHCASPSSLCRIAGLTFTILWPNPTWLALHSAEGGDKLQNRQHKEGHLLVLAQRARRRPSVNECYNEIWWRSESSPPFVGWGQTKPVMHQHRALLFPVGKSNQLFKFKFVPTNWVVSVLSGWLTGEMCVVTIESERT